MLTIPANLIQNQIPLNDLRQVLNIMANVQNHLDHGVAEQKNAQTGAVTLPALTAAEYAAMLTPELVTKLEGAYAVLNGAATATPVTPASA